MANGPFITQVAESTPFDPANCDPIDSENVQGAIEELCTAVENSASPGFTFGRSGNTSANTWLLNDGVPSNRAGRTLFITGPTVTRVFSASENLDTYDLEIYEHQGDEIGLTLLTTLSVVASRTGDTGSISIAATSGEQLAIKLVNGAGKNVVAGVILSGTV